MGLGQVGSVKVLAVQTFQSGRAEIFLQVDLKLSLGVRPTN